MPRGVGKTTPCTSIYNVHIISYSGPSGILGSDRKQSTAKASASGVTIVALSISPHEQTQ